MKALINLVYILSAVTFILGFKLMSSPVSARRGNIISGVGMLTAIVVTLMFPEIVRFNYIMIGAIAGAAIGVLFAYRTPMTGMPQMVGLLNGFGGLASWFVAFAEFESPSEHGIFGGSVLFWAALIGAITFSGSLIAWAKLEEKFISGNHYL
ncbi:MAG: NAD(P)(+) transhydrogenase (Re/Si-specific) subunit beta [Saprospiraceae bacterium]